MDQNDFRNNLLVAGFFEMNQFFRQSSESDEEFNSRVIFFFLRRMENNDFIENIYRFEFERYLVLNKF